MSQPYSKVRLVGPHQGPTGSALAAGGEAHNEVGVLGDTFKDQGVGTRSGLKVEVDDTASGMGVDGRQLGVFQMLAKGPAEVRRFWQGRFFMNAGKNNRI